MTNPGRCPHCNGTFYTPDPDPGGAGRNKCLTCQRASPVRDFYQQQVIANPEGYRTDKKTGNLRPAREHELHPGERLSTDKPAAPIRQYKDDN